jgi:hypothetical protein
MFLASILFVLAYLLSVIAYLRMNVLTMNGAA